LRFPQAGVFSLISNAMITNLSSLLAASNLFRALHKWLTFGSEQSGRPWAGFQSVVTKRDVYTYDRPAWASEEFFPEGAPRDFS